MVEDLQLRHHRRTDLAAFATGLAFGRTDLVAVMVFVEAHEEGVLALLVTGSDRLSAFGLPAVRETFFVAELHHSRLS